MTARATTAARIALVTRRFWPQVGGAETALADLAVEFHKRGRNVTVVTAQWDAHWPVQCVYREVPVVRLPQPRVRGWGTIRYLHALSRWLRANLAELDAVLVSHLKHDAYATVRSLARSRVPVIVRTEADEDLAWQRTARFGGRVRNACAQADGYIVGDELAARALAGAGYSAAKTELIAPGVDLQPPRDANLQLPARLSIAAANPALEMVVDAPLVVFAGRLADRNGLKHAIVAWSKFVARRPNGRLWMIGDGPERDTLYDLMVDLGVHHQAFLPGSFDDVADLLTAADIYVAPAVEAGQGQSLREAMAYGVPVIATDIASHRQLIEHEVHGLLVPPRDPAALHQAIERLVADRPLAARLGAAARERIASVFSLSTSAEQYLALLDRAVAAKVV